MQSYIQEKTITYSSDKNGIKILAGFDFLDLLILGETGTGKTHIARLIHELSPRKKQPFIAVNCAELTPSIIEAELFGYEKGAFTGAVKTKIGKFEAAAGGTLFLDEIGELTGAMQAKLLKIVEEKQVTRVGSIKARPVNLRIIYATNRNLDVFREDLCFRIAAHTIKLKPLRERPDEIISLAEQFIEVFSRKSGHQISIGSSALQILRIGAWRGNIRELRSFIEKVCLDTLFTNKADKSGNCPSARIELTTDMFLKHLRLRELQTKERLVGSEKNEETISSPVDYRNGIKNYERNLISVTLTKNKGNVSRTAIELGLSRTGLRKKINLYAIVFKK